MCFNRYGFPLLLVYRLISIYFTNMYIQNAFMYTSDAVDEGQMNNLLTK